MISISYLNIVSIIEHFYYLSLGYLIYAYYYLYLHILHLLLTPSNYYYAIIDIIELFTTLNYLTPLFVYVNTFFTYNIALFMIL
jgi:hypothetical protein